MAPLPLRYDMACQAIAAAKTVDEVSEWIDKAAAVREYSRRIKNRQLEIDAIEIRVRAKRRRGEILAELKARGQLREGRKKLSSADDSFPVFSLADLDVTADESSEEQKIAQIEGNSFERLIARCRAYTEANPKLHSFDVLKPPPERGPINGARTVMGSRVEPDESLDYFPTPPWATRALMERVLPHLGAATALGRQMALEPACGEGHIAEVLQEYFGEVIATDIHDYGYGDVQDFLGELPHDFPITDWIITNPPFNKKTEAFLDRALSLARVGVALFVRMQWLETQGRYERIYRDRPPTVIAFFAERVPLCKGEWKPDGDTATAYIWLCWLKGRSPRAPYWIAPDCRELCTRPDDVERFTTHPVTRKQHIVCDEPFDPSTGELPQREAEPRPSAPPEPAAASAPREAVAGSTLSDDIDVTIPDALRRRRDPEARP
jgi:hypothetical protein